MFQKYKHLHFVGIGGIGMSGLARIWLNLGYRVSGSDLKESEITHRLAQSGADIFKGHRTQNVNGADVVVVSSAVAPDNAEVRAARKLGIVVVPRAEMLAELMRLKYSIAVAGSHGKTTTTSLIACILESAGLDPTVIIGGKVNHLNGHNARLGRGEYLVAEADESDRSFLKLLPTIGVITNIDPEHLECYGSFEELKTAFVKFANQVPFYGAAVVCHDHPVIKKLLPQIQRRCVTYGQDPKAHYFYRRVQQNGLQLTFEVGHLGKILGEVRLNLVGRQNAVNAVAALAVGRELGISFERIRRALGEFQGVERRFQILRPSVVSDRPLTINEGPIIVDDYAHHPVEINATLEAARLGWPRHRLTAVVQPHRYSRLKLLFGDFVKVLRQTDELIISDVYPAGETPLAGVTGKRLWQAVSKKYPQGRAVYAKNFDEVRERLKPWLTPEHLILFLGAGSISTWAHEFAEGMRKQEL